MTFLEFEAKGKIDLDEMIKRAPRMDTETEELIRKSFLVGWIGAWNELKYGETKDGS